MSTTMDVYTTCATCRKQLKTDINEGPRWHTTCTAPPANPTDTLMAKLTESVLADDIDTAQQIEKEIDKIEYPPRLAEAALWYARWGWPVFPLRPVGTRCDGDAKCRERKICLCPKKPATTNGLNAATTDESQIREWWTRTPQYNIGLATGNAFDVVDIDTPDGIPFYLDVLKSNNFPAVHAVVSTASSGIHLYIEPTGRGNTTRLVPGVDVRGQGGYVVAPPSWLGRRGTAWSYLVKPSPAIIKTGG